MLQDSIPISFTITNNSTTAAVNFEAAGFSSTIDPGSNMTNELVIGESFDFSISLTSPETQKPITTTLGLQFEQADDMINILMVNEEKWHVSVVDGTYSFGWPEHGRPEHLFLLPVSVPIGEAGIVIVGTVEMPGN